MPDQQTYHGSCHCGAVRYEAKSDPITQAMSCNCSMCRRKGTLLAFIPAADFTLETGESALADYQFNRQMIHHLFCRTCGVTSFARGVMPDGTPMVALNVRCIDEIDPETLTINRVDGKSF
ncbi:MAG: GFA family protein [Hyphomicrobium zavarzinii]|uniref:GFA family protein n=1 Tax=Hyphomicrobium zavarzinii TaxID=48292 RepID=UPI001A50B7E1|nr:GFA family protein [Hyphomicrobium zavarzinii]MBL8845092.1 GFA family protein [Hyphomicrobium zavarzinii]